MKLVDTAGCKMRIRKIGLIKLMVILVIYLPLFVHPTITKNTEKHKHYHKKINSNDHFTVPGLSEMEIGLGHKIDVSQNWI